MNRVVFHGRLPEDRRYCPRYDMWVKESAPGEVLIGASAFGIFLAGVIVAFCGKPKGAEVAAGRGMGTIESRKTVLAVRSPLSFILLESNEALEERPESLNSDPYEAGWMVRAQPSDWRREETALVNAAAYRAHILSIEPEACFD